jgi:hypothetical protein
MLILVLGGWVGGLYSAVEVHPSLYAVTSCGVHSTWSPATARVRPQAYIHTSA